jgi:hypothetical protein
MHVRTDLGSRVELVSMDPSFHDVSVGLYRKDSTDGPVAVVHSYASKPGIGERIAFVTNALAALGGLEPVEAGGDTALRLPCGGWHNAAMKRLFLDCFRVDPGAPLEPKPLEAPDTRSEQLIRVRALGAGRYRVEADEIPAGEESRAPAIARALVRLAELDEVDETTVAFPCGHDHHELVGVMLVRAQNLRAALREEELIASRGVLTAPSAQESNG